MKFYKLLLALPIILSGCSLSPLEEATWSTDKTLIAKYAQNNPNAYKELGAFYSGTMENGILMLCEAYTSLKMFKEYRECKIKLDENHTLDIKPTDNQEAIHYKTMLDGRFKMLDAQVAYDLGDYQQAKNISYQVYESIVPNLPFKGYFTEMMVDRVVAESAGLAAIMALRENDTKSAEKYLNTLENLDPSYEANNFYYATNRKKYWLARVYLAKKEYQAAHDTLIESSSSLGSKVVYTAGTTLISIFYSNYSASASELFAYREMSENIYLCHALLGLKQYDNAKACYQPLVENKQLQGFGNLQFSSFYNLGLIAKTQNDLDTAIKHFNDAINILEAQRSSIALDGQKIGFLNERLSIYSHMIEVQYLKGNFKAAFEYSERAKARALVDLLASKKHFGTTADETELLADLYEEEYNSLSIGTDINTDGTRSVRALKRKINQKSTKLASVTSVNAASFNELAQLLKGDETVIEFFGSEQEWYAFVVNNTGVVMKKLTTSKLEERINELRQEIKQTNNDDYKNTSQALFTDLIAPLQNDIKHKNITIIPHGALHYLPFATLYDGNEFLIDKYNIRLLPSVSVLSHIQATELNKSSLNMLALGNPDLGEQEYALPAAEKEVLSLGKINSKTTVLISKNATETAIKEQGGKAKILHIASHGEFDSKKPLNSRLLLAADSKNDGYLTVNDIYSLELNADLVTLSACETGLGDIKKGDDVIGLTRGFIYAGANSIVSSLWKVDDEATEKLMVNFYQNLSKKSKSKALRAAQLTIRNSYNEHPFYWASFQLTGKD